MGFIRRNVLVKVALAVLAGVLGCGGGGDLTSVASSLVETQRLANLARTAMDGTWKGYLQSVGPESARQTLYLEFSPGQDNTLVMGLMILENIDLDGTVARDTFRIQNGIFDNYSLRFNIAIHPDGSLVLDNGHPVLFEGELTENSFVSGEFNAGPRMIATWEAVLFQPAQAPVAP